MLSTCVDIFNEPPLIKGAEFSGWIEGLLNILMFGSAMITVYFALMGNTVVFYIALGIFFAVSMKNVWNDTIEYGGKI